MHQMKALASLLLLYFKTTASSLPTLRPSQQPSFRPSYNPSISPSWRPSILPSSKPSRVPSISPTRRPTAPTAGPTAKPSKGPTIHPTYNPTISSEPTISMYPTYDPTTSAPSISIAPTYSFAPTYEPTTLSPTTCRPTHAPFPAPSIKPTSAPAIREPSLTPSATVTTFPSTAPAAAVTKQPSIAPASAVTRPPSIAPAVVVTLLPTTAPAAELTPQPSTTLAVEVTTPPSIAPAAALTTEPSIAPVAAAVTLQPSITPAVEVTTPPSMAPAVVVSPLSLTVPATVVTLQPSGVVTPHPTSAPATVVIPLPSSAPTKAVTMQPTLTATSPSPLSPTSVPLITSQPSIAVIMTIQPSAPATFSDTSISPVAVSTVPTLATTLKPQMTTIPSFALEGFPPAISLNPTSLSESSAQYNFQVTQFASNVSVQAIQSSIGQLAVTSAAMQALSYPSAVGLAVTFKSAYSQKMRWRLGAGASDATIVYTASFSFSGSAQSAQYLYLTLSSQLIGSIAQGNFTDYFLRACENCDSLRYTFFDTAPNISLLVVHAATEIPSNQPTVSPSGGTSSSTSALSSQFVGVIVGATIGFLTIAGLMTYYFMKRSLFKTKKTAPLPVLSASEGLTIPQMEQASTRAPFVFFTGRQISAAHDKMSEISTSISAKGLASFSLNLPMENNKESAVTAMSFRRSAAVSPVMVPTEGGQLTPTQKELAFTKDSNKDLVTDQIACTAQDVNNSTTASGNVLRKVETVESTDHPENATSSSGWRPKPYNTVTTGDPLAPLIFGNSGDRSRSGTGYCGFDIMSPIQYQPSRLMSTSKQRTYDDTAVPIGPQSLPTTAAITGSGVIAATTSAIQTSTQAQPVPTMLGGVLAVALSPTPIEPGGGAKQLVLDMETEELNDGYDPNGSPVALELKALREQLHSIDENIRWKSQTIM